ncbi:MAG: hypothetical protein ACRDOO_28990, partial [Actinomadura sp.]
GKLPVIATARPELAEVQSSKLEVNALRREASGLVALSWTVTNTGSEQLNVSGRFTFGGTYFQGGTTVGVNLFDATKRQRYRTLRDQNNHCVCTDFTGVGRTILAPGQDVTFYNLYKLPPEVTAVTVEIPDYVAAGNVPIS